MAEKVETEVKLRMPGPAEARALVRDLGAQPVRARHFEDNVLFDDVTGTLIASGCALRVRITDTGAVLTFKGPRREGAVKSRAEIETAVADGAALLGILGGLGFRRFFRYQKYREVFAWRGCEIVLDETPMGTFLEIEGTEDEIGAAASALGRGPSDYVSESYAGLFAARGEKGDMVFPDTVPFGDLPR